MASIHAFWIVVLTFIITYNSNHCVYSSILLQNIQLPSHLLHIFSLLCLETQLFTCLFALYHKLFLVYLHFSICYLWAYEYYLSSVLTITALVNWYIHFMLFSITDKLQNKFCPNNSSCCSELYPANCKDFITWFWHILANK